MAHIELSINDKIGSSDKRQLSKKVYQVVTEKGIFKNGKLYQLNDLIELSEKTAINFLNNNEIKET